MAKRKPSGQGGLKLRVLGEVAIERDGERLVLPPSRKTRALLGYLLVEPREHSREHLCGLFWDAPDDPRGALRWSLSRLRPLLASPGEPRLLADRERVRLDGTGVSIDLHEARALAARGDADSLAQAAALFRGELLEGLELAEAFRFQAWCTARREEAKKLHGRILEGLCAALAPEPALNVARRLVELDPSDEAAHRRVIELLAKLGRPREALAQYDSCREILRSVLGAAPSQETEAARRALSVGSPAQAPQQQAPQPPPRPPALAHERKPLPGSAALVGREREVALLEAQRGAVLAILGEPGIGKSRLLEEAGRRALAAGGEVLRGRSYEAEQGRPYGCIVDALRGSRTLASASEALARDLSTLFAELGPGTAGLDRTRLFDAAAQLLREAAQARPILLVLDDAHWIDEASAALVHYLARSLLGEPVTILLAAREGELADNAAALRLVRALRREERGREVRLDALDEAGIAALLRSHGLRGDPGLVHAQSEGNALLALEIGRALDEGRPLLSGSLAETLEQRLSALGAPEQALLAWAAAAGSAFSPQLLASAMGQPPVDFLGTLSALERHGLLREREDGLHEFTHDLLREASYRRVPAARRTLHHSALARALWERPGIDRGAVARQAMLGGEHALAVRASLEAARHAQRVFAGEEALALAERAVPLLHALPQEERLRTHLALLDVRIHSGPRREQLEPIAVELSRIILEAQATGRSDDVAEGFRLLSHAHYFHEDESSARKESLLGAEAARGAPDPLVRALSLAQAGRCLALIGEIEDAEKLLVDAELAADAARVRVTDIPLGFGLVRAFRGQGAARQTLEDAAALAHARSDHWRETEALFALCRAALEARDSALARRWAEAALPVAEKMTGGSEPGQARALLALASGDDAGFEEACAELLRIEARWRVAPLLLLRAELALSAGDRVRARALTERVRGMGGESTAQMRHGRAHLVLAELALLERDHAAASASLTRCLAAPGGISAHLRSRVAAVASGLASVAPLAAGAPGLAEGAPAPGPNEPPALHTLATTGAR